MSKKDHFIKSTPSNLDDEVQYYYRRGDQFFFRTMDKQKKMTIRASPKEAEKMKSILIFGNTYKIITE